MPRRLRCHCFAEGTLVATAEGLVPIEAIEAGDQVLAYDDATGYERLAEVVGLYSREVEALWVLDVGGETIEATEEHPFFVAGQGWTEARELRVGDVLVAEGGERLTLEKIERVQLPASRVYNFEVAGLHDYFAGEAGVLGHNCELPRFSALDLRTDWSKLARAGEDLYVDTYRNVRNANLVSGLNPTHTPHHVVQNAISGVSRDSGIAINLRRVDPNLHKGTRTFSRSPDRSLTRRQHLALDIRDVRRILRNEGYSRDVINRQMAVLIRQNKLLWHRLGLK
jgi:intein/homing endonuclease